MRVGAGLLDRVFWNAYNRYWGQTGQSEAVQQRVEAALGHLTQNGATPPQTVLDVGCGSGVYTLALARLGFRATGVDSSANLLAQTRRSAAALKVSAEFEKMDLDGPLWYTDGEFDHLVCAAVLHWLKQPADLLKELHRVVKPGGLLVLTVWLDPLHHQEAYPQAFEGGLRPGLRQNALKRIKDMGEHSGYARYWTPDALKTLLTEAGFTIVSLDGSPLITAVARAR